MKIISFLLFGLIALTSMAQDGVSPLVTNPDLYSNEVVEKATTSTFDSTVYYTSDTVAFPFFDDFSRSKFQRFTSTPGDAGLTDTLFYKLIDENTFTPLTSGSVFTQQKTYRLEYDITNSTTILDYFDSTRFVYDNLKNYPLDYISGYGYPPYIIYDTIGGGSNTQDTVWVEEPEFVQDSARLFFKQINDSSKLWLNNGAYHNYRFAVNPWSLGVVSFDGLNKNGYPYNFGSTINQRNDTLLSKPIDLSTAQPSDSIYFSFLYQKEGWGDTPEAEDSLYLEFYSPVTKMWNIVWRTGGGNATDFQVAHLPFVNSDYFGSDFQFRFVNFSSPAGGLDHFHIDYVNFRPMSGYQDTLFKDFALVYPISTLLKDYISVPWKHYQNHPNGKMGDSVVVSVRNGSALTENNQDGIVNIYYEQSLEGSHTLTAIELSGGNINYAPRTTYVSYHDFTSGYAYDPSKSSDTMAIFDYEGIASAKFPNEPINDTTFGQQLFKNYYAYDDGTAEKAYGVTGAQGLLAYKFTAYQPDSLIAIQIHFVPSVVDVSNDLFVLTVWDDNNGKPGNIIYEDNILHTRQPHYMSQRNAFATYFFEDTSKIAVEETFYIGMRQLDPDRLNIGFDMNHDNSDKIFWSINGGYQWNSASDPGSMLMRPVVTSKLDYLLGVKEQVVVPNDFSFTVYPNPAQEFITIKGKTISESTVIAIYDLNGRMVYNSPLHQPNIAVSSLQKGMYIIHRIEDHKVVDVKKLIVQ